MLSKNDGYFGDNWNILPIFFAENKIEISSVGLINDMICMNCQVLFSEKPENGHEFVICWFFPETDIAKG